MNGIIEAMIRRRSVRQYTDEVPPKELVDQVIEAGMYAASGMGYQNTKVIAIENKDVREELRRGNALIGGWKEDFDPFYGAPVWLLVISKKDWGNRQYDGALVMGNMMLAAYSLSLGSCWINRAREQFDTDYGRKLIADLGIEGEWEGVGYCALGYPAMPLPEPPKRKDGRVYHLV